MTTEKASMAIAQFYTHPRENPARSREEGRPIFEDVEMIRINWSGDTKRELHAQAAERSDRYVLGGDFSRRYLSWAEAFPDQYKAFKANQEQSVIGTPLKELPFMTNARAMEMKALNIHTAEQLAALDGAVLQRIGMDGRNLKNQAAAYLERAAGAATDARMLSELALRDAEIAEMKAQMAKLIAGAALQPTGNDRTDGFLARVNAEVPPEPAKPSPFEGWEDDDLRNFVREAAKETGVTKTPGPRAGHATLVKAADDANEDLRRHRERAAA